MKTTSFIAFSLIILISMATHSTAQTTTALKGLKMQYKISGEGPSLVLVPGGLTGWISWDPFIQHFSSGNRRVVQVQLLNVQYGLENRYLPQDYSVRTESEALAAALHETGIDQPVDFIAWSYGALTTLDFALNYPQLVKSLILIEPPALWVLKEHHTITPETQKLIDLFKTLNGDITEDQLEIFMNGVGFAQAGTSVKDHPKWNDWKKFRFSLRNSSAVADHRDNLSRLKNFHSPVLLVKGTASAPFLHEIIDALSRDLPNSQTIEFPEGHAPHMVSKDKFLEAVDHFYSNK